MLYTGLVRFCRGQVGPGESGSLAASTLSISFAGTPRSINCTGKHGLGLRHLERRDETLLIWAGLEPVVHPVKGAALYQPVVGRVEFRLACELSEL